MAVTATLKFVLREVPASRESDGMVYLAHQNVPKGVPARVPLDETPLSVACTQKMWRTALQRTQALAASGSPLWIVDRRSACGRAQGRAPGSGQGHPGGRRAARRRAAGLRPGRASGPGSRPCVGPRRLPPPRRWRAPC